MMAANAKNENMNGNATFAFTLPISCQICLGKVKEPVICPNQHAFCRTCMDVWLARSEHCPACRVPISAINPCKLILGGLNQQMGEPETDLFSSKKMRQARTELLFKEYESTIEHAQMEVVSLQRRNDDLERQLLEQPAPALANGTADTTNPAALALLTRKLHDTTVICNDAKAEIKKLKRENKLLKEQNANFKYESNHLRSELVGRSPRKFGRFTVATLESRLVAYEREVGQLQRALERSDAHISGLDGELREARTSSPRQPCPSCHRAAGGAARDSVNDSTLLDSCGLDDSRADDSRADDSRADDSRLDDSVGVRSAKQEDSFQLEMPSPVVSSRVVDGSSCKKKLRFSERPSARDDFEQPPSQHATALPKPSSQPSAMLLQPPSQHATTLLQPSSQPSAMLLQPPSQSATCYGDGSADFSSTDYDQRMNTDVDDCLELLDAAERRQHRQAGGPPSSVDVLARLERLNYVSQSYVPPDTTSVSARTLTGRPSQSYAPLDTASVSARTLTGRPSQSYAPLDTASVSARTLTGRPSQSYAPPDTASARTLTGRPSMVGLPAVNSTLIVSTNLTNHTVPLSVTTMSAIGSHNVSNNFNA